MIPPFSSLTHRDVSYFPVLFLCSIIAERKVLMNELWGLWCRKCNGLRCSKCLRERVPPTWLVVCRALLVQVGEHERCFISYAG